MRATTHFTTRQRIVVEALAQCVVPHAYDAPPAGAPSDPRCLDLTERIEARLATAPARIRGDIATALRVLDTFIARLFIHGRAARWESLGADERLAAFSRWGSSRVPQARSIHQALRRLILATYYATPQGREDIGALPPLAGNTPRVSWEGPVEGEGDDDRGALEELAPYAVARSPNAMGHRVTPRPRSELPTGAITSGNQLAGDVRLTADVVVVGSGAGGAVAATRLAEAGKEVIVLEGGGWVTPESLDDDENRLTPLLFADQGLRATDDVAFSILQGSGVGGGTRVNWMIMLRTPDHVLDEWERSFGLSGLNAAALAPHFARIEQEVHACPLPDVAHSPTNRVILDGARALGWRSSSAILNARGCVRAGTCSLGCRYGAKQDALSTYLPRAFAKGARLLADVHVDRVQVVERRSARVRHPMKRVHARVVDRASGATRANVTVEAPVVILAAGAVETPAILMRSSLGGGGVGRYLRLHPTTCVMGEYDREMYPMAGIPLSSMCDEFVQRGTHGYGFWIEAPALTPVLAAVATSGIGAAHRAMMQRLRRTAPIIALVRDGADTSISNGEISLYGDGSPRISYRLGPSDRETLVASLDAAARLHFASGAREVRTLHTTPVVLPNDSTLGAIASASYAPNDIGLFSAHVNGTCRMGTNPAIAGTTPDGERHGTRGLYICDGSLLPTAPGVNPQETIMTLASIVSEGIAADMR